MPRRFEHAGRTADVPPAAVPQQDLDEALIEARVAERTATLERENATLRMRERKWRDILQSLPAAVYTTDAEGRIDFYNEAAAALAGRRPQIGVDRWCITWQLYTPDGRPLPHEECPMAVALNENRAVMGMEIVAERPDGARLPLLPFPVPLHDDEGRLVGALNMLVDISERKQAESHQQVLLDELNHRVKNNLQLLYSLLRTAARETEGAEARAVLLDVGKRVDAMRAAQSVVFSSRAGAGTVDMAAFLDSVCDAAAQTLGEHLEILCEAGSGELPHDALMPLALILNELLTNAAKHGRDGDGWVRVRVALRRNGDGRHTLAVADSGPGFQPAAGGKRASGLGLVRGLASQLGGSFCVEDARPGARCIVDFRYG